MNDGTDEEDPRAWSDTQIRDRLRVFVDNTRAAANDEYHKCRPAEILRDDASELPRDTAQTLIQGAAAFVIDKIENGEGPADLWCSVLRDLLGIDWSVEDNPL